MNKQTAQKAARWWADQLRGHAKLDNGDQSETGAMTFVMSRILQSKEKAGQTPAQVDRFESALAILIYKGDFDFIDVDYHPDPILEQAADEAGLSLGMASLPWKTTMHIDGDKVTVRCGYGAPAEEL